MSKGYLLRGISFTILPISIISVQHYSSVPLGSTTIYWIFFFLTLLLFLRGSFIFFDEKDRKNFRFVKVFLLWNIFCITRGAILMSENYWDYKSLVSMGMAILMPIIAYGASSKEVLQSVLSFYVKYTLPFFIIFIPFLPLGGWGWYLFPISFLIVFFPALKIQWKVLVFVVSLIAAFADISSRSHVFKFIIPFILIFLFYYFRPFIIAMKYMQLTRYFFLIIPWFFFSLAVMGVFNVFKIDEYIKVEEKQRNNDTQALNQDSRTFLYEEVLSSALKHGYWPIGRSPARGNDTHFFAVKKGKSITGRNERVQNEANILNIFTWTGIIGVLFYFLIFIKASYLAINRSNNIYIKILGVFIAFRWAYAWVEDYSSFDLNNYVIWMMIGCCLSDAFRRMTNEEVKLWVGGIFEKKYYLAYWKYMKSYT